MGIHKDGEMVGFWVRGKSGKNVQMVSTAWRHGGWPPGASAVAGLLQVEVSCAEVGFCSRWVRVRRWNYLRR